MEKRTGSDAACERSWEAYVLSRMKIGARMPIPLLDHVDSMFGVVKLVEHIGRASIAGYSERRPSLRPTGQAREEMIRVGFSALSEGYPALRRIAASVADGSPAPRAEIEQWGALKLFGWLGRSYESNLVVFPEFEKARRDEAQARSIYQGWRTKLGYRPAETPLTMLDLARELSVSVPTARALTIKLGFAYRTNTRLKHLFTKEVVEKIKSYKESLLDRNAAAAAMGVDRNHFDALVHEGVVIRAQRFTSRNKTSDRFDLCDLIDAERSMSFEFGNDWRTNNSYKNRKSKTRRHEGLHTKKRFRKEVFSDGLTVNDAASVLRVNLLTARKLVDIGVLAVVKGRPNHRRRLTLDSVERARARYALAQLYARYLPDRGMHQVGDALAALGASPLSLGPGATDVVERRAARKALNLSRDPDQAVDSRTRFWRPVENAIRSAGLPFRSMQVIQKDGFVFWDSSRLVRIVFTIAGHGGSLVGAVASTAQASRRAAILPYIVRNLRGSLEHSSGDYELDGDDELVARLRGFDVYKEDGWPKACRFVTDYLTQVRHGLYDARANLSKGPRQSLQRRRSA